MAMVSGILLLDKPSGLSSNTALQKVRHQLNASKAGHSGTLDPMATGLLPIGLGQGTKAMPYLLDAHKRYLAEITLGVTTSTGDAEGEVIDRQPIPMLTEVQLQSLLAAFCGVIEQVPPMYSALKRDGRPLYELARAGITVVREARKVTIYGLELLAWSENTLLVQVWCSKGTYIRTLAEDIGHRLGCGAHLTLLRRIGVAGFDSISEENCRNWSWCPWDAVHAGNAHEYLLPIDVALNHFASITVSQPIIQRLGQGQKISMKDLSEPVLAIAPLRLYDEQNQFYGLVKATPYQGLMLERWMHD